MLILNLPIKQFSVSVNVKCNASPFPFSRNLNVKKNAVVYSFSDRFTRSASSYSGPPWTRKKTTLSIITITFNTCDIDYVMTRLTVFKIEDWFNPTATTFAMFQGDLRSLSRRFFATYVSRKILQDMIAEIFLVQCSMYTVPEQL